MSIKRLHPLNPLIVEMEYEGKKVYYYWCEGCQGHDAFDDTWKVESWNPLTIHPSVRMSIGGRGSKMPQKTLCHVYIKNGKIQYLNDCAHKLAGKTVLMSPPHLDHFQGIET